MAARQVEWGSHGAGRKHPLAHHSTTIHRLHPPTPRTRRGAGQGAKAEGDSPKPRRVLSGLAVEAGSRAASRPRQTTPALASVPLLLLCPLPGMPSRPVWSTLASRLSPNVPSSCQGWVRASSVPTSPQQRSAGELLQGRATPGHRTCPGPNPSTRQWPPRPRTQSKQSLWRGKDRRRGQGPSLAARSLRGSPGRIPCQEIREATPVPRPEHNRRTPQPQ